MYRVRRTLNKIYVFKGKKIRLPERFNDEQSKRYHTLSSLPSFFPHIYTIYKLGVTNKVSVML
jgi:hypothetical protein